MYLMGQWTLWRNRRAAARLGAICMPVASGKWPGGLDMVIDMLKLRGTEYALDRTGQSVQENGRTFIFRLFWQDTVCTRLHKPLFHVFRSETNPDLTSPEDHDYRPPSCETHPCNRFYKRKLPHIRQHVFKKPIIMDPLQYIKGERRFGEATRSILGSGVFSADG
jgi:hypothetical protein